MKMLCLVRPGPGQPSFRRRAVLSGPMLRDADELRGLVADIHHVPGLGKVVHDHLQPSFDELGNQVLAVYPWGAP